MKLARKGGIQCRSTNINAPVAEKCSKNSSRWGTQAPLRAPHAVRLKPKRLCRQPDSSASVRARRHPPAGHTAPREDRAPRVAAVHSLAEHIRTLRGGKAGRSPAYSHPHIVCHKSALGGTEAGTGPQRVRNKDLKRLKTHCQQQPGSEYDKRGVLSSTFNFSVSRCLCGNQGA